jgi:hypothetical protein
MVYDAPPPAQGAYTPVTDQNSAEAPQWKRRRKWNYAGAAAGLLGFLSCGVAVILGRTDDSLVDFAWASISLFLVSSGIYVGTALIRQKAQ